MCKKYYQVVNVETDKCILHTQSKEEAEAEVKFWDEVSPELHVEIIKGTDYIREKCRGCNDVTYSDRYDHYGIPTGYWCDKCYDSNKYPYRKDAYDPYNDYGTR